ncbi:MAG: hypothetical protein MUF15_07830, partial [Acidobacteria bacterium]|nr:hypothetical protein [Acidobacteriota bacterium]
MKIKILATDEHGRTRTKHNIFIVSGRGRSPHEKIYVYSNNSIVQASETILPASQTILPASQTILP